MFFHFGFCAFLCNCQTNITLPFWRLWQWKMVMMSFSTFYVFIWEIVPAPVNFWLFECLFPVCHRLIRLSVSRDMNDLHLRHLNFCWESGIFHFFCTVFHYIDIKGRNRIPQTRRNTILNKIIWLKRYQWTQLEIGRRSRNQLSPRISTLEPCKMHMKSYMKSTAAIGIRNLLRWVGRNPSCILPFYFAGP